VTLLLALDFGGTRIRAAVFTWAGGQLIQGRADETRTRVEDGEAAVIARLLALGDAVCAGAPIAAVGIAAPGPLDGRAGVIHHAKTLPGWANVPLAARAAEHFGVPAFIENDGNLGAWAEYRIGAAQHADPAVYLTISTGIGGGAVIGGRLFTGWSGLAIELGHMRVPNAAGVWGRLESVASGTGLAAEARAALASSSAPSQLRALDPSAIDGAAVGAAAEAGDMLAGAVVARAGEMLGYGLVNLVHVLSPQAIVIGGSTARLGERLLGPARAILRDHVLDPRFLAPDLLRPAALGDGVCLQGAALWAADRLAAMRAGGV
jgi:glucokinase